MTTSKRNKKGKVLLTVHGAEILQLVPALARGVKHHTTTMGTGLSCLFRDTLQNQLAAFAPCSPLIHSLVTQALALHIYIYRHIIVAYHIVPKAQRANGEWKNEHHLSSGSSFTNSCAHPVSKNQIQKFAKLLEEPRRSQ